MEPLPPVAKYVSERFSNMETSASNMVAIWRDVAAFCAPSQNNIQCICSPTTDGISGNLYDDEAIQAGNTFAAGSMAYMFPISEVWFGFTAPYQLKREETVSRWYAECAEILRYELAASNFYSEIHDNLRCLAWAGTTAIYLGTTKKGRLYFENWSPGKFYIAEDDFHDVDTVARKISLSNHQAMLRFGADNLSEKVKAELDSGDPKKLDTEHDYVHLIYPRPANQRGESPSGLTAPRDKPVASVYLEWDSKHVCMNGGYEEMPVICSRLDKMDGTIYGRSLAMDILPTIRSSNTQQGLLEAMAEKASFPPILAHDSMDGQLDLTPGGITLFDSNNPQAQPHEWANTGRYDIGKDRAEETRERIRKAFFNDIFQVFMDTTKRMATYEAMQLAAEKFALAHPMFSRFNTSTTKPLLERAFALCLRNGRFPPPPEELLIVSGQIPSLDLNPNILFQSRAALALQQMANRNMDAFLDKVMYLSQVNQSVLDNIDFDKALTEYGENLNVTPSILVSGRDVAAIRQQRQQQQEMQQTLAAAQSAASTAKDAKAAGINLTQQ